MKKELKEIPIFFAIDDQYIPFLAVALKSLIENANKDYKYLIKVLHTNVQEDHMKQIRKYENENATYFDELKIDFVNDQIYCIEVDNTVY